MIGFEKKTLGVRDLLGINIPIETLLMKIYSGVSAVTCLHSDGVIHINATNTNNGLQKFIEAFKPSNEKEELFCVYTYSLIEGAFTPMKTIANIIDIYNELGNETEKFITSNIIKGLIPIKADIGISNEKESYPAKESTATTENLPN